MVPVVEGLTAGAVADAHRRDLEIQDAHGVRYLRYWFDDDGGRVFCLVDAPSVDAAVTVHRAARGLLAHELIPVQEGS